MKRGKGRDMAAEYAAVREILKPYVERAEAAEAEVEQLRAENDGLRHSLTDAADQLAQQQHEAQIKYDNLWDEASVMLMDEVHDHALTMDNLKGRCELAEAEAERLREALGELADREELNLKHVYTTRDFGDSTNADRGCIWCRGEK